VLAVFIFLKLQDRLQDMKTVFKGIVLQLSLSIHWAQNCAQFNKSKIGAVVRLWLSMNSGGSILRSPLPLHPKLDSARVPSRNVTVFPQMWKGVTNNDALVPETGKAPAARGS
jgi:hypothetical protein